MTCWLLCVALLAVFSLGMTIRPQKITPRNVNGVASDIVGLWHQSDCQDYSGTNNHMTCTNVGFISGPNVGLATKAFSFSTASRMSSAVSNLPTGDYTIAMWLSGSDRKDYLMSFNSSTAVTALYTANYASPAQQNLIAMYYPVANCASSCRDARKIPFTMSNSTKITANNEWTHYAFTWTKASATFKVYEGGAYLAQAVLPTPSPYNMATSGFLSIGNWVAAPTNDLQYMRNMSTIVLASRVLTDTEISILANVNTCLMFNSLGILFL